MFGFKKAEIIPTPTGRVVFVGRVPIVLGWKRKDGAPMTQSDVMCVASAGVPSLLGYTQRSYANEAEARAEASRLGVEV